MGKSQSEKLNPKVDLFLRDGCGRCELGGTPECKVNDWKAELKRLRKIMVSSDLTEEVKWGVPCYSFNGSNVIILGVLKDCCTLGFFKGVLLKDAKRVLGKPGENTHAARQFRFTSVEQIVEMEPTIKEYVAEAIEIEKAGLKVDFTAREELAIPEELQRKFDQLPALKKAFEALTPGRQRGYLIYFSAAKQSKTRESRIEKCTPDILEGRGFHD